METPLSVNPSQIRADVPLVRAHHDSKVLTRRTFRCRAWDLGSTLDWAREHAGKAGFAGVTVACEPTGHRWRVLGQLAADRGMS
jgi:hypothetical protein